MPTTILLKLAACLTLVVALIFGWHELTSRYDRQGYERRAAEDKTASEAQTARNLDLQRQAEKRYVVQSGVREKYIVETIREIRHDTENLAACVLTPAAVDRLRHAAECASEDRPAACGTGESVPGASPPH